MPETCRHRRYVRVALLGGLGNQLFAYTFGALTAHVNKASLVVETSGVGKGRTNHGVSIENFGLGGQFIDSRKRFGVGIVLLERNILLLSRKSDRFKRLITKIYPHFQSQTVGRDLLAESLPSPINVFGYFQSYEYLFKLREAGLDLTLHVKSPSDWYEDFSRLATSTNFVALHVRRGDYSQDSDRYGLLDADYYQRAIRALPSELQELPVWVFSDANPNELPAIIFPPGIDVRHLTPPPDSHPLESLLLMTKARANIIANSTFSWWSAALNVKSVAVVAPDKWYKGMDDPRELIPPSWLRVQATWEDY
jgi:hypothetical protein